MMKKTVLCLAIGLCVGPLTGCSHWTRSEFSSPAVEVPAQWAQAGSDSTVSQTPQMDHWWQRFADPQLDQIVTQVLATNNDLALATLTLAQARLQAGIADRDQYPDLSASLNASSQRPLTSGGSTTRRYGTTTSISYEVDLWDRLGALKDSADWTAQARWEDRESTAQSLVATTATLYWQIGYLQQRLQLAQSSIQYAEQTLKLAQDQYRAGAVSQLDVLEARRSLASQEATQRQLEQQLVEAQNAFAVLFGAPSKRLNAQIQRLPDQPIPQVQSGLPAEVLLRRPDVRAHLSLLRAALAEQDAVASQYLPTLTLTGSVGTSSSQLENLLRNPVGTLGAGLVLPFLNWHQMDLNKQLAANRYQQAVVSYRQTLYQAFADVENALSARRQLAQQHGFIQAQYQSALAAEKIYESRYQAGAVSMQNWLDAQQQRRSAQMSLLENHFQRLQAQATLYQALGGGDVMSVDDSHVQ
ncbi:efflux transporter outer membrane subunit [Terasakiispira papahanaumokuakeensis]|nr:efflux transporter outer membrane subunit [Terasakiispira papahanaumokuakeensis]